MEMNQENSISEIDRLLDMDDNYEGNLFEIFEIDY